MLGGGVLGPARPPRGVPGCTPPHFPEPLGSPSPARPRPSQDGKGPSRDSVLSALPRGQLDQRTVPPAPRPGNEGAARPSQHPRQAEAALGPWGPSWCSGGGRWPWPLSSCRRARKAGGNRGPGGWPVSSPRPPSSNPAPTQLPAPCRRPTAQHLLRPRSRTYLHGLSGVDFNFLLQS